jgi:hypothetical protein
MRRKKVFISLAIVLVLVLMWQVVQASPPVISSPAHQQVRQILYSLRDSEAEHASGAYVPGVGVVFSLELLRGPNTIKNKPAYVGTRDWTVYLMQTFGPKLTAVPASETISFSVDFYDYAQVVYHQLVISSKASEVADPAKYKVWLDGKTYAEATGGQAAAPAPTATPAPSAKAATPDATSGVVITAIAAATATPAPAGVKTQVVNNAPAEPIKTTLINKDAPGVDKDWKPLNGKWAFSSEGYTQAELGKYDLISYYNRRVGGNFKMQVDMKYIQGQMGGGLVFNAPATDTKNGASMVSFTGEGSYIHWGYYDSNGVFQFQGGSPVPTGQNGKTQTLAIEVSDKTFNVSLNGVVIGQKVPITGSLVGYPGLLASTSEVLFNNLKLENV